MHLFWKLLSKILSKQFILIPPTVHVTKLNIINTLYSQSGKACDYSLTNIYISQKKINSIETRFTLESCNYVCPRPKLCLNCRELRLNLLWHVIITYARDPFFSQNVKGPNLPTEVSKTSSIVQCFRVDFAGIVNCKGCFDKG